MAEPKKATYEGRIHVRQLRRGVVLDDDPEQRHVDDWIVDIVGADWDRWEGRMRITVEVLE